MRVAVSAQQADIDALVSPRFGRGSFMIFADSASGEWTTAPNTENEHASGGVGVKAAEELLSQGAEALITGHIGPAAQRRLTDAGVRVYRAGNGVTVRDALARLALNDLEAVDAPTVAGHWALPARDKQR